MFQHTIQVSYLTSDQFGELIEERSYRGTLRAMAEAIPPTSPDLPEYLTRKETAKTLRISLVTLHEWTKAGTLQSLTVRGRIRYRRADVVMSLREVTNSKTKR